MGRLDPDSDYAFDITNPQDADHLNELRKARGIPAEVPELGRSAAPSEAVSASAAPVGEPMTREADDMEARRR